MKFTYGSGQRPLDGYTLKRGIGRGGFGEVYFGISDGGKEVALKLLRGNQDVELRGVAQCLNLKHPHLVSLYDLRTDAQGDTWVVMEYIAGEPLSVVLGRHPRGLAPELVQQWFLALARAVAYLHDHGIVHRDLKPGNIFLENGTLKVGDYGLCKFISGSQGTRQSQSVGTVHYMAPEVSTGNYNKQIDIYAAGIILYEMLTGKVPFEGESAGEILMKHLTAPPDLSKLPPEYVAIVAKALSKNPAHRYASMTEMARAVEAVGVQPPQVVPVARPAPAREAPKRVVAVAPEPILTALPAMTLRGALGEVGGSMAWTALYATLATLLWLALQGVASALATSFGYVPTQPLAVDTLSSSLGSVSSLVQALSAAGAFTFFFLTLLVCWAVLIPAKLWAYRRGDPWLRRLVMLFIGLGVGLGQVWLDGWLPRLPPAEPSVALVPAGGVPALAAYLTYFGVVFFALRWWKMADPRRKHRFGFAPILATGFWSLILLLLFPQPLWAALVLVMASGIIQLVSPWEPPPPPAARRVRLRYA